MTAIFVYGTLRDPDLRAAVLGPETAQARAAVLPDAGVWRVRDADWPAIRTVPGALCEGVLLTGLSPAARARLAFFEAAFTFDLRPVTVMAEGAPVAAEVFWPETDVPVTDVPWSLADWRTTGKPLFVEMALETMALYGHVPADRLGGLRAGILRRALARLRARAGRASAVLGSGFGAAGLADVAAHPLHDGFFATRRLDYRHRLFDGTMSAPVSREVFVTGDGVTVLPWDPRTDRVLLIEQARAGLIARGDPDAWSLEVIAGLCDRDEARETTARREAREEAGLSLGRMIRLAGYYSSPGAMSEHLTSFVAEADLSGPVGVHGLDSEGEDIRSLIVTLDQALDAVTRGEARNAPLVISLWGLAARRAALATAWGYAVAAPGTRH